MNWRKLTIAVAASFVGLLQIPPTWAKPPSWDTIKPAKSRFRVLKPFGGAAVLDTETGLVWERSPNVGPFVWAGAQGRCYALLAGSRKGWRMPTVEELASLVDATQSNPALPSSHPFLNVDLVDTYWTSTTLAANNDLAWVVDFSSGVITFGFGVTDKGSNAHHVWCVRGEHGHDAR
jgi:hypothetical protein